MILSLLGPVAMRSVRLRSSEKRGLLKVSKNALYLRPSDSYHQQRTLLVLSGEQLITQPSIIHSSRAVCSGTAHKHLVKKYQVRHFVDATYWPWWNQGKCSCVNDRTGHWKSDGTSAFVEYISTIIKDRLTCVLHSGLVSPAEVSDAKRKQCQFQS